MGGGMRTEDHAGNAPGLHGEPVDEGGQPQGQGLSLRPTRGEGSGVEARAGDWLPTSGRAGAPSIYPPPSGRITIGREGGPVCDIIEEEHDGVHAVGQLVRPGWERRG